MLNFGGVGNYARPPAPIECLRMTRAPRVSDSLVGVQVKAACLDKGEKHTTSTHGSMKKTEPPPQRKLKLQPFVDISVCIKLYDMKGIIRINMN